MALQSTTRDESGPGRTLFWHVALVTGLSAGFEGLFLHHGINVLDEGVPLYAATRLLEGGTLYQDVFFLYPPGHLLPALLGALLDPPGVIGARVIYALFTVALCVALYLLGRRLVPPGFALLASCMVAVAAPDSHLGHSLFGYLYLVLPVLALLAFDRRLGTGDPRWMLLAGAWTGVAVCFRLVPAFAVAAGLGLGVLAASRDGRTWLRDGGWLLLGAIGVVAPVALWLIATVGADTVWREIVDRPAHLVARQSLPVPPLELPGSWSRHGIAGAFQATHYRWIPLLTLGYAAGLAVLWMRARRADRRFDHALLLATVAFGAVLFLRALGRSGPAHINGALPPACLLLAHGLWLASRRLGPSGWGGRLPAPIGLGLAGLAWLLLMGSDTYLNPIRRGVHPMTSLDGRVEVRDYRRFWSFDRTVERIRREVPPGGVLLDTSAAPLLYVLSGRAGPGGLDVLLPGTFRNEAEEIGFLARLEAAPPAAIVTRLAPGVVIAGLERVGLRLGPWILERYERAPGQDGRREYTLLIPRR